MKTKDQDLYHKKLLGLLKELDPALAGLRAEALQGTGGEASGSLSDAPLHLADLGSHEGEEEVTLTLLGQEQQLKAEVVAALDRLADGTFGRCQTCGQAIPHERLRRPALRPHLCPLRSQVNPRKVTDPKGSASCSATVKTLLVNSPRS